MLEAQSVNVISVAIIIRLVLVVRMTWRRLQGTGFRGWPF